MDNISIINNSNDEEINMENDAAENVEQFFNYRKLRVPELKALAKQKGLSNYANLKKQPLIDLLKANK